MERESIESPVEYLLSVEDSPEKVYEFFKGALALSRAEYLAISAAVLKARERLAAWIRATFLLPLFDQSFQDLGYMEEEYVRDRLAYVDKLWKEKGWKRYEPWFAPNDVWESMPTETLRLFIDNPMAVRMYSRKGLPGCASLEGRLVKLHWKVYESPIEFCNATYESGDDELFSLLAYCVSSFHVRGCAPKIFGRKIMPMLSMGPTLAVTPALEEFRKNRPGFMGTAKDVRGCNLMWYILYPALEHILESPSHFGYRERQEEYFLMLKEEGCDPNHKNELGLTFNDMMAAATRFISHNQARNPSPIDGN